MRGLYYTVYEKHLVTEIAFNFAYFKDYTWPSSNVIYMTFPVATSTYYVGHEILTASASVLREVFNSNTGELIGYEEIEGPSMGLPTWAF